MVEEHEAELAKKVPADLERLASAIALTGEDIESFTKYYRLPVTVVSHALGTNTAALYGKKNDNELLQANISLLLRLYASFDQFLPRFEAPTAEQLIAKIQEADPSLPEYVIGPLLGMERTSGHRIKDDGLQKSTQTSKLLAWLVYTILCEDLRNWEAIKNVLTVEAAARGIPEPEKVLRKGQWKQHTPVLEKPRQTASASQASSTRRAGIVKKKPRRGTPEPGDTVTPSSP